MNSSNPTSVEEGKETLNSDPVPVSNDTTSAEKRKGKKRTRGQTQVATDAKGEGDSQSVDEPEANEGTSSSASTSRKWTKSAINYLQAENEKLKQAFVEAKRMMKSPHSTSVEAEKENPKSDSSRRSKDKSPRVLRRGRIDPGLTPCATPSLRINLTPPQ